MRQKFHAVPLLSRSTDKMSPAHRSLRHFLQKQQEMEQELEQLILDIKSSHGQEQVTVRLKR